MSKLRHYAIILLLLCSFTSICKSDVSYNFDLTGGTSVFSLGPFSNVKAFTILNTGTGALTFRCIHGVELCGAGNSLYIIDHWDHHMDKLWEIKDLNGKVFLYDITDQLPIHITEKVSSLSLHFNESNDALNDKAKISMRVSYYQSEKIEDVKTEIEFTGSLLLVKPNIFTYPSYIFWTETFDKD